jgi:hypothetical protein
MVNTLLYGMCVGNGRHVYTLQLINNANLAGVDPAGKGTKLEFGKMISTSKDSSNIR